MSEECEYYYYDCGYCCSIKREEKGNSSVNSDDVHKYCWGYHYEDCPLYKQYGSSSGGCYITSACTEARGLPDDCHELTVLRSFRDSFLRSLPTGEADISEYYATAPKIVEQIKAQADAADVFETIYINLVKPCVEMIERGENEKAYTLYKSTVKNLQTRFLT